MSATSNVSFIKHFFFLHHKTQKKNSIMKFCVCDRDVHSQPCYYNYAHTL